MSGLTIRKATAADGPFLIRMLPHAAYPPWHEPRPTPAQVLRDPAVARYVVGWPRPGDAGVVALDRAARRIGAAWYRLPTAPRRAAGIWTTRRRRWPSASGHAGGAEVSGQR